MDHGAVLHVGAGADADRLNVATQNAIVPDARVRADHDVTDNVRTGRNEGGFVNFGHLALEFHDRSAGKATGHVQTCYCVAHSESILAASGAW